VPAFAWHFIISASTFPFNNIHKYNSPYFQQTITNAVAPNVPAILNKINRKKSVLYLIFKTHDILYVENNNF